MRGNSVSVTKRSCSDGIRLRTSRRTSLVEELASNLNEDRKAFTSFSKHAGETAISGGRIAQAVAWRGEQ